jgi:hypothetical protein
MAKFLEVQSYLMLSSGVKAQFEQRRTLEPLANLVVGGGIESRSLGVHQLSPAALIAR